MPYNYQFADKTTGDIVPLNDVDRQLCERTNEPYNDRRYCCVFITMTQFIGLVVLSRFGKGASVVTAEMFDEWVTWEQAKPEAERCHYDDEIALAREFMVDRYQYELWYGR